MINIDISRKEAWDKVSGKAKYAGDYVFPGMLFAALYLSKYPHALIKSINLDKAYAVEGVISIVTGDKFNALCGSVLKDRPPLAIDRARYYGEPVAIVIADNEMAANAAAALIEAEYEELPIVESPTAAIMPDAFLLHKVEDYEKAVDDVHPQKGANISTKIKIRKGDINKGFKEAAYIEEATFCLPQSDHIAMETRCAVCEIMADGSVNIMTSSQSPFSVRQQLSKIFKIEEGKIRVHVPLVGGGFGGKSAVFQEILAYIASYSVNGRAVKLALMREQDIICAPCRMGLDAKIKFGMDKEGYFKAAEMVYLVDSGAYCDISPKIAQAIAVDGTGPYNIENVYCDSMSVYTNHPYVTAYRGFGHESYTFCIERVVDKLAKKAAMDPFELRLKNCIRYENFTPTQVKLNESNMGNLEACLNMLKSIVDWREDNRVISRNDKIIAKGISAFWKTTNTPSDAVSGAVLTFNSDGGANLTVGVVEYGQASKTHLAQILAEKLSMNPGRINVNIDVRTENAPEHWKTVASLTNYLAGRAVLNAAEDALRQLKALASVALRCPVEDLDIENERVFIKHNPEYFIGFQDLVHGLKYADGNNYGGQIIGRGGFGMSHLTKLAEDSGKGKPGHEWTTGAQEVEIEYDKNNHKYKILKAVTVLDIGKSLNPGIDKGIVKGGMSMALGIGSREKFVYRDCRTENTSLRTYKVYHKEYDAPAFIVEFVETPNKESPYGSRAFSEHGIIGIHAALANALSAAAGCEIDTLPLDGEAIWQLMEADK
ncbi:MAG: xanthine dehydrogenase family protein molybdopterin-binding subunit [Clostridia bacterium]|nr:xanthine dehydrogenase family protein molybdopterin-binding subunit [Clostridia bacterium]